MDINNHNSFFKLPLNTSLNSPGGALLMKLDTIRIYME